MRDRGEPHPTSLSCSSPAGRFVSSVVASAGGVAGVLLGGVTLSASGAALPQPLPVKKD